MMMQSRIILTFIATIGTNSSLAQDQTCNLPGQTNLPRSSTKDCPGEAKRCWCGNNNKWCPEVTDDCAKFVPFKYYYQVCSSADDQCVAGRQMCWQPSQPTHSCTTQFDLKPDKPISDDAGRTLFYTEGPFAGCPKCYLSKNSDLTGGNYPLPQSVQLNVPMENCTKVQTSGGDEWCPAGYTPSPENPCQKDYSRIGDQCCLHGHCPTCESPWTKDQGGKCVCPLPFETRNHQCVCREGYTEQSGTCVKNSGPCPDPFVNKNNQCVCKEGYTEQNGTCVKNSGPTPDSPGGNNDDGFPLWLLILIIVLAVLAALIATWIIYRCCKKEPESDIKDQSSEGVYGERGSFVAASANSEMQIMTGIACAEGAKTHISAVDPNWSPSDDSITARRTTPNPDRSNVIRQGQVVEYV